MPLVVLRLVVLLVVATVVRVQVDLAQVVTHSARGGLAWIFPR